MFVYVIYDVSTQHILFSFSNETDCLIFFDYFKDFYCERFCSSIDWRALNIQVFLEDVLSINKRGDKEE